MKKRSFIINIVFIFCVISLFVCGSSFADCWNIKSSPGQTLYLPVFYNNYDYTNGDGENVVARAVSRIVIRNTDPELSINVFSAIVYSPNGEPLKEFFETPSTIGPLASISFLLGDLGIPYYDRNDGYPCLILRWEAEKAVNQPFVTARNAHITVDGSGFIVNSSESIQGLLIKEKGFKRNN